MNQQVVTTRAVDSLPGGYWRLWSATVVSGLGDGAVLAALPLLAVSVTGDPRQVAAVSTAAYLPWLVFSLIAGVMADRVDRRRLMWTAQVAQAAATGAIAIAASAHLARIWLLCAAALWLGIAETVFDNAGQSLLPQIVAPAQLRRANASQYAGQTVSQRFVGPPLGSLLFVASAGLPFAMDAVSFLVSAALIARVRLQFPRTVVVARATSLRAELGAGLRWLLAHRLLRGLAMLLGINNLCNQMAMATMVLLATHTFGLTGRAYGLLLTGQALGALVGSAVNQPLVRLIGSRAALFAALITTGVTYIGAGLAPNVVVLGGMLALSGVASMVWNIVTVSLRQHTVPADLLGRVNSAYRTVGWGVIPLGAIAGGLLAHGLGLRAPLLAAESLRLAALLSAVPLLIAAGPHLSGKDEL